MSPLGVPSVGLSVDLSPLGVPSVGLSVGLSPLGVPSVGLSIGLSPFGVPSPGCSGCGFSGVSSTFDFVPRLTTRVTGFVVSLVGSFVVTSPVSGLIA